MKLNWTREIARTKNSNKVFPMTEKVAVKQPKDTLECVSSESIHETLDNLVVNESVRRQIQTALNKLTFHQTLYVDWGLGARERRPQRMAMNLYGPPGTGKTHCARAFAKRLGKPLINARFANLESKFHGESAVNLDKAFDLAERVGAVLFFDEADALLGARMAHASQGSDFNSNGTRATLLDRLDRFNGVALFATNFEQAYDPAFVRRMLAHIEFEMPDGECRRRLWEGMIPAAMPKERDVTIDWLSDQTEGLAGGDLCNVLLNAAAAAVARDGEARRVSRSDILTEVAGVRAARLKVGRGTRPVTVRQEAVTLDELPETARTNFIAGEEAKKFALC